MTPESIFTKDNDWRLNACLNFQPDMSHGYIYGYKKSADALVLQLCENHYDIDYLIYPILFLYRHHIELQLKNLLSLSISLYDSDEKTPITHNLENVWSRVKGYYRKLNSNTNAKEIKYIDKIVNELFSIDANSMSFRYSTLTDGKKPNPDLKAINIKTVSLAINNISDILQTFEYQLNHEIEIKNDYLTRYDS